MHFCLERIKSLQACLADSKCISVFIAPSFSKPQSNKSKWVSANFAAAPALMWSRNRCRSDEGTICSFKQRTACNKWPFFFQSDCFPNRTREDGRGQFDFQRPISLGVIYSFFLSLDRTTEEEATKPMFVNIRSMAGCECDIASFLRSFPPINAFPRVRIPFCLPKLLLPLA